MFNDKSMLELNKSTTFVVDVVSENENKSRDFNGADNKAFEISSKSQITAKENQVVERICEQCYAPIESYAVPCPDCGFDNVPFFGMNNVKTLA